MPPHWRMKPPQKAHRSVSKRKSGRLVNNHKDIYQEGSRQKSLKSKNDDQLCLTLSVPQKLPHVDVLPMTTAPSTPHITSNVSLNSNLSNDLLCMDQFETSLTLATPSTPLRHAPLRSTKLPHGTVVGVSREQKRPLANVSSGPLFDISNHSDVKLSAGDLSKSQQNSFLTTPTKVKTENGNLALSAWGIPQHVLEQYSQRGITSMFPWQVECLSLPGVLSGRNIVYSAPTSAGKTLVAELLALKCALELKKKVMFVLPFVSIAHEKLNYLRSVFEPAGVKIGGFMGNHSPPGGFSAINIAICTIEKANSLVNRLLEDNRVLELGLVVVDELHMVGDTHRGYLLELLLTKLLYVCRERTVCVDQRLDNTPYPSIQIVGMSATLPNLNTLARWLGGQLYHTNFRPVPLQEMVKIGPNLYDTDFKSLREYSQAESLPGDEDDLLLICRETVLKGHSVLIFCPTKAWCENLAVTLGEAIVVSDAGSQINKPHLLSVYEQLRKTQVGIDPLLARSIPHGVAFHHAGLTMEEREIVEGAFRQTLVKVLVATSTLSSGVNLPARLVIIRTPFFQRALLDVLVYKQMVGRAGRKGVDQSGESILICKPNERSKIIELLKSKPKPVTSCLGTTPFSTARSVGPNRVMEFPAMKRALLEVISSSKANTMREIETFASCTLLYSEMRSPTTMGGAGLIKDSNTTIQSILETTLEFLVKNEFVSTRFKQPHIVAGKDGVPISECVSIDGSTAYYATQLGMATVSSSLSPDEALIVFGDLMKARRNFVLENELHTIYLVTPVYVQNQWPTIDWYKYLCLWERLSPDMKHVAETLGIRESFLARAVQGRVPVQSSSQKETLRIHKRFYTALAFNDLVHEVPIVHVAKRYGASKGLLQNLQSAAGTFAGMVTVFCSRLGWKNLELLLSQFQTRLSFGVERELCELVRISLLNGFHARVLFNAGFHTLSTIATANPISIETCLRSSIPFKSCRDVVGEEERRPGTTWCGKLGRGMSEDRTAQEIVSEAQRILSEELQVPLTTWRHVLPVESGLKQTVELPPVSKQQPTIDTMRKSRSDPKDLVQEDGLKKPRLEPVLKIIPPRKFHSDRLPSKEPGGSICLQLKLDDAMSPPQLMSPSGKMEVDTVNSKPSPPPANIADASALNEVQADITALPYATNTQGDFVEFVEDSFISFSPILSSNSQNVCPLSSPHCTVHNSIHGLLPSGSPQSEACDRERLLYADVSGGPLTIPDSLTCSIDMSLSLSCNTYAMIDAACCQAEESNSYLLQSKESISNDSTSSAQDMGQRIEPNVIMMVTESPLKRSVSDTQPKIVSEVKTSSPRLSTCERNETRESCEITNKQNMFKTPLRVVRRSKIPESPFINASPLCLRELSSLCSSQLSQSGVTMIDVTSNKTLFDTFVSECLEQSSISFSIATSLIDPGNGCVGAAILPTSLTSGIPFPCSREQCVGVAFCWGELDVYYLSLSQSAKSISMATRVQAIVDIFTKSICSQRVISYNLKKNAKYLALSCGILPLRKTLDPKVGDWMLNPDLKEKTIHGMVLQYLPDQPVLAEEEECEEIPISNLATHASNPMVQASAESLLGFLLVSKLEPLLKEQELFDTFINVEMPSLLVLTKLELNGIGFSPEACNLLRDVLQVRISELEREAYSLAKHTFSLTSPEDVAQVLFIELNLPCGESKSGLQTRSKAQKTLGANRRINKPSHLSTAKNVLEKIVSLHPLPGVVLEWRRMSFTLSKMVFPLFKEAVSHTNMDSFRVHPTAQVHTATGRVTLTDPSLQMVPRDFEVGTSSGSRSVQHSNLISDSQHLEACQPSDRTDAPPCTVCMRNIFVPFKGGVMLAADYSQLELRILAHMSGDVKLRDVLNQDRDVFKMMASEWLRVLPEQVSDKQRQETKQICYGMLYGIGPKALGEQLDIPADNAAQFMESFKMKYSTMRNFLTKTVQQCKENGYIRTLFGRKRFLPGIHSTNMCARNQAERQAINSTVQGSAADFVKSAMIKIDQTLQELFEGSVLTYPTNETDIEQAKPLKGAYLVLQLHDELLYEVVEGDLTRVAKVIREGMENAMEMSVKFPVKMKVGCSWGRLEPYL